MSISVIRYETKPERAAENQQLIEKVFAELAERASEGLRYASLRLDDGVTFVHVVDEDGETSPLTELPAFAQFQAGIGERVVTGPTRHGATLVGSYRIF